MKWFGVKTIYRVNATGKPKYAIPKAYDPDSMIEERVVLFKGRSFDEAIEKAEREAKKYTADTQKSPYGQTVRYRHLDTADAFVIMDPPADGVEVFSMTEICIHPRSKKEILDCKFGPLISTHKMSLPEN